MVPGLGKGTYKVKCVKHLVSAAMTPRSSEGISLCPLAQKRRNKRRTSKPSFVASPAWGRTHVASGGKILGVEPWRLRTPAAARHFIEPPRPSLRVARAEVNSPTSSGRVFAFPLPSPQIAGRAHLRSWPGLCPGFLLSRAGRQGGRRRASGQESSRKSGRRLFPSLIEVRSAGRWGSQRELEKGTWGVG
jgi:hypothetical protein